MVKREYIPDAGDVVWTTFNPQLGREQSGRRPALVLSPRSYNSAAGLALTCPITSKVKGYPFEVAVNGRHIKGAVLADQIRSLDFRSRQFIFVEQALIETMEDVRHALSVLLRIS